jgi:ribonuclease HII
MDSLQDHKRYIAGCDEVGRGPLAGPVMAAAVVLSPDHPIIGLADSKQLSERRRAALAVEIRAHALVWAIGRAEVAEIDTLNILQASLLAMKRAVENLAILPDKVLVDGKFRPELACPVKAIVKGDATVPAIGAASILAKVERDREMLALHARYPVYGFDRHKGYPTAAHRAALAKHGACPEHRRSFAPVREVLGVGGEG